MKWTTVSTKHLFPYFININFVDFLILAFYFYIKVLIRSHQIVFGSINNFIMKNIYNLKSQIVIVN